MARIHKTPVTVFLVAAAIPLIPEAALYRAMNCLMRQDLASFTVESTYALLFAASMSAGITLTTIIFHIIWRHLRKD
ncbi:MAG: threonine/serine exporter family protein [Eubacteriales bacterium]|nr:threonine/serine exporter family protein [Eubacteriales bacterium]